MENITNASSSSSLPEFPLHFRILKLSLYGIIFATSLVANVLVCTVILRRKKMKTVTNYFILNLAMSDLTLTCICIPFDIPVQELHHSWPYGSILCKILYPMQTYLLFTSVFTLTAVSLARQRAIVYPMKKQLTKAGAKIVIAGIWLLAFIPVTPYFQALKFNPVVKTCEESWDNSTTTKVYTASVFIVQYVLPFCIMFYAYFRISRELRQRAKNGNRCLKDLQEEEARKVTRMLKVVTTLFALCLLPNNVMWLWLDYGNADKQYKHFREFLAFSNILILANSAGNPICYTVFNKNYRQEIKGLFKSGQCGRKASASKKDERIAPPGEFLLKNEKNRSSTMTSGVLL